jgi:hypothetical protein
MQDHLRIAGKVDLPDGAILRLCGSWPPAGDVPLDVEGAKPVVA